MTSKNCVAIAPFLFTKYQYKDSPKIAKLSVSQILNDNSPFLAHFINSLKANIEGGIVSQADDELTLFYRSRSIVSQNNLRLEFIFNPSLSFKTIELSFYQRNQKRFILMPKEGKVVTII